MSEIKGGMLALIINGPFGENLGRAVTVDYFIGDPLNSDVSKIATRLI